MIAKNQAIEIVFCSITGLPIPEFIILLYWYPLLPAVNAFLKMALESELILPWYNTACIPKS
jgi:hypothetical protein